MPDLIARDLWYDSTSQIPPLMSAGKANVLSLSLKCNPVWLEIISSAPSAWNPWPVCGKILLSDCNSVGKPRHPPAVRANGSNGVITQRRNCQVYNRRMSARIHDVSSMYVFPAPGRVVTKLQQTALVPDSPWSATSINGSTLLLPEESRVPRFLA